MRRAGEYYNSLALALTPRAAGLGKSLRTRMRCRSPLTPGPATWPRARRAIIATTLTLWSPVIVGIWLGLISYCMRP